MEPLELARHALLGLQAIVGFLEDRPTVELHHQNYRKLPTARARLRGLRQALRDYAETNHVSRQQEERLGKCDRLITECLPELAEWTKQRFSTLIDELDRTFRSARLVAAAQLPPLPTLPKGVPNWISVQLRDDYLEVGKCFRVQANRAAVAFAARMVECALGHRFLRRTGQDPVAAKWTLGKLIDEAKNQGVLDDVLTPGVEDVLKWLNKTRVAGVHVKPKIYNPNLGQVRILIELTLSLLPQLLAP
jgi:hypothetical protein